MFITPATAHPYTLAHTSANMSLHTLLLIHHYITNTSNMYYHMYCITKHYFPTNLLIYVCVERNYMIISHLSVCLSSFNSLTTTFLCPFRQKNNNNDNNHNNNNNNKNNNTNNDNDVNNNNIKNNINNNTTNNNIINNNNDNNNDNNNNN